jgi:phosphatidylinositol alpha-mannosyltransferase
MPGSGRPLRICLVSAAYRPYPSGVSEHVHHLAKGLRDLGQDVRILTTEYPGLGKCSCPVPVTRFGRAILVPMNRSYATLPVGLRMPGQVKRFLAGGGFDVVHCHGLFWPEISYWAIRHSRTVNVVTFLTAGFRIHTLGSGLFRSLFRRQLARIAGRIAISRRARRAAEPYVPGEYRIIPCGIDLARFSPDLARLPDSRARAGILFLGRLDQRKGADVLLEALSFVLKSVPAARVTMVGQGRELDRLKNLGRRLGITGSVDFVGPVSQTDLPRYYAGCRVYCSPALGGETLGIVLLEAMASGAPVVASDIPGYDETVRRDVDGLLVPPGRPRELAAALTRTLTDDGLCARLSAAGLARVEEYAWPEVAARTLDFYRELLAA